MSGPFQKLDVPGLDDSLVCIDGVCAVPATAADVADPTASDGVVVSPSETDRPE